LLSGELWFLELVKGISFLQRPTGMKRGLVIGKFMPVHQGHISLIRFAAGQVDELIVSMSYTPADPIDQHLRYTWLKEIFKKEAKIKVERSLDDFDDPMLPMSERTKIWSSFIQKRFPPIDVLFSSEGYAEAFSANLGVPHVHFDPERIKTPVSATLVRNNPFQYWEFIPDIVKPYFVKKICFYGPESTGKSALAKHFAKLYETEYVPEVARELITSNDFTVDDIIRIGRAQTERVLEKTKTANKFLFCDTDLITTQIYSRHYLHEVPPILLELEAKVKYDLYFLLDIDVAWVADGLRDLGDRRKEMYEIFKGELDKRGILYSVIRGRWDDRIVAIQEQLSALANLAKSG
jgi:HTH-type transcriptional repressor of NAD biosynthesis genes